MARSNFIDETNNKYGKLVVLHSIRRPKDKKTMWYCQCDCGNTIICSGSDLRAGRRTSCGKHCNNIINEQPNTIHGFLKILHKDPTSAASFPDKSVHWICECLLCHNIVSVSGRCLRNGDTISCGCIKSRGEQFTLQYLNKNNYKYKYQQKFEDLISQFSSLQLSYDFGVYNKNNELWYLIEIQGQQHYEEVKFFGDFHKRQLLDQQKLEYCKSHNYNLLYINTQNYKHVNYTAIENIIKQYEKEILKDVKISSYSI